MPRISKLRVSGFRSIKSTELELDRLNVVVGANGSGKSNLIGVFRFLDQIISERLQLYVAEHGGSDRILHHGQKTTNKLEMRFDFGVNAYSLGLIPAVGDTLVFSHETIYYQGAAYATPWNQHL